ncbi:hypothetical protein BAPA111454_28495 [Bacillus paranthracis]
MLESFLKLLIATIPWFFVTRMMIVDYREHNNKE